MFFTDMPLNRKELISRLEAAQGKRPCDLILKNARYLDVFSGKWQKGELAIHEGVIVGLEPGLKAKRVLDAKGSSFVPGFIDAHVHIESSLLLPHYFDQAVLPKGTTSAVCDPHELANVKGVEGIKYFLKAAQKTRMNLRVMLSSCVPATSMETNGGGKLSAADLVPLLKYPKALGLAEVMNMPGVLHGDPSVMAKLKAFSGRKIDGHCPLLRGKELSAYASAGISSCHESSELGEASEKLRKGIAVWIREGSVAKDLDALIPLLTLETSTSIGFCTDDRNPLDIASEGHIDYLVRQALGKGVSEVVAYRSASWTVARHYQLDCGPGRTGAIAPGYEADLVWLEDSSVCAIKDVIKSGHLVSEWEGKGKVSKAPAQNTMKAKVPEKKDLEGPPGAVHVIEVIPGKIITGRSVEKVSAAERPNGICRLSVLERYGKGRKPANSYVRGFGALKGAIASSVGHDSHNLIVVGEKLEDMRVALATLIRCGGGFTVVQNERVAALLPLPFGGLMSNSAPKEIKKELEALKEASRAIGCALSEPFLQLAFLSLPVIPSLKLTDRGLVDVDLFKIIDPRAS